MKLIAGSLTPLLLAVASMYNGADAFSSPARNSASPTMLGSLQMHRSTSLMSKAAAITSDTNNQELSSNVAKLKRVLEQEYISFFNPMVDSWYAKDVTFNDPMTSLSGVESYRNNVDMLAGRTLMGKVLFDGAGIQLHSVTGGGIKESSNGQIEIEDIITRWTLKVTAKILPWKPEAVFSGISVYKVQPGGEEGEINHILFCQLNQTKSYIHIQTFPPQAFPSLGKLITGTLSTLNQILRRYHPNNNTKKFQPH